MCLLLMPERAGLLHALGLFVDIVVQVRRSKVGFIPRSVSCVLVYNRLTRTQCSSGW